ncbi:MAG: hypothetical protein GY832_26105 [Chloroflexi bacterium]|nr:hypothetical protein [Chloroflexota bacterium]
MNATIATQTYPRPTCPECGGDMVLRRPRRHQDWDVFWGCKNYPGCRGSRKIGVDGKPVYYERDAPVWASGQWE